MNLASRLSQRIGINDIHEILYIIQGSKKGKKNLYDLLFHKENIIAYRAAWVLTHFSLTENEWLVDKQNELIDEVLKCEHPGKRRLLLNIIYQQPLGDSPRVDFLDFCMERMSSKDETLAVQTLCIKLAYELCRSIPELLQEFRLILDIMQQDLLPPSIHSVRKNVLKAMKENKSLQKK